MPSQRDGSPKFELLLAPHKPSMLVWPCNPNIWEMEAGGFIALGHSSLPSYIVRGQPGIIDRTLKNKL